MNIYSLLRSIISKASFALYNQNISFTVERPKNHEYGDFATNYALIAAKILKQNPDSIAQELIKHLKHDYIGEISYINKFINFKLSPQFNSDLLDYVFKNLNTYGLKCVEANEQADRTAKDKVNIEFVSANPTGPLHIGHTRGAILGQAIVNLLKMSGHEVTAEYLINDYGSQIKTLAKSVIYRAIEFTFSIHLPKPQDFYPGSYLLSTAQQVASHYKNYLQDIVQKALGDLTLTNDIALETISAYIEQEIYTFSWFDSIADLAVDAMMQLIKQDLDQLGIKHDVFFSEKSMVANHEIKDITALLQQHNLIQSMALDKPLGLDGYEATINTDHIPGAIGGQDLKKQQPDVSNTSGQINTDVSCNNLPAPDDQSLACKVFRSDLYGDTQPRVVVKANGETTYFASDLAYTRNKIERGFTKLVYILGFDHIGYVARIEAGINAIANVLNKPTTHDVRLYQLVNYLDNGNLIKMSKRSGNFETVSDVLKAICLHSNHTFAKNVLKFMVLSFKSDTIINFDIKQASEQSQDNIFFYLQYAYARVNSIINNAARQGIDLQTNDITWDKLYLPQEQQLITSISCWPYVIQQTIETYDISKIVKCTEEIARLIHSLWNLSIDSVPYKIITQDIKLTAARIGLLKCAQAILKIGSEILGIELAQSLDKIS